MKIVIQYIGIVKENEKDHEAVLNISNLGSSTKNGDYVLQDVGKAVLESYSRVFYVLKMFFM